MTYRRLPDNLPAILRNHGIEVIEIPGWRTRGRPASTGEFKPVGVLCHHTGAYDRLGDTANDTAYAEWLAKEGRSDLPAPLAHLALSRGGVVFVLASGRANHAGRARSSGTVAAGDGNALYIGIEAMNDGKQGWDTKQYQTYAKLCAVLSLKVTHNSVRTVRGHKETSTTGKWDPGRIDMNAFRELTLKKMNQIRAEATLAERASMRMGGVIGSVRRAFSRLSLRKPAQPEEELETEPTS